MIPGEILTAPGELELNKGRNPITIEVANTGDRPIQVGSHYHFFETNDALKFDRKRAKGMRLDIAAGTAVRFEPGQSRTVRLTPYLMGGRESHGFQARVSGKLGPIAKVGPSNEGPTRISRSAYADMFGPTAGDKVRLADTELFIEVEKDHTTYGEEVKFGGGKVIRDGMGQSQRTRARGRRRHRHHQRADRRSLGHREGRYRPQGRPHRRHRQGRQPRHPAQASTSSSARAPRRSPAKARSSPRAASTATSISSARSRSTRRSIAASPP